MAISDDETLSSRLKEVGHQGVSLSLKDKVRGLRENEEDTAVEPTAVVEAEGQSVLDLQHLSHHAPPGLSEFDPKQLRWTYIDPTGKVQGRSSNLIRSNHSNDSKVPLMRRQCRSGMIRATFI